MPEYRLCCVGLTGSVASSESIEAPDDEEAIRIALELNRAARCELWHDERFVAVIGANHRTGVKSFVEDGF